MSRPLACRERPLVSCGRFVPLYWARARRRAELRASMLQSASYAARCQKSIITALFSRTRPAAQDSCNHEQDHPRHGCQHWHRLRALQAVGHGARLLCAAGLAHQVEGREGRGRHQSSRTGGVRRTGRNRRLERRVGGGCGRSGQSEGRDALRSGAVQESKLRRAEPELVDSTQGWSTTRASASTRVATLSRRISRARFE